MKKIPKKKEKKRRTRLYIDITCQKNGAASLCNPCLLFGNLQLMKSKSINFKNSKQHKICHFFLGTILVCQEAGLEVKDRVGI